QKRHDSGEKDHPFPVLLGLETTEYAQRVDRWDKWGENGGAPSEKTDERLGEPRPHPTDVSSHVHAKAHLGKRQHSQRRGEEECKEEERDSGDLALEGTAHSGDWLLVVV